MTNISVPCTNSCDAATNCPVKALNSFKPLDPDKESVVLGMLSTTEQIHSLLEEMGQDPEHGDEIQVLLSKPCSGTNSCGHKCDAHELGHHGDAVKVDERSEHICDPESLQELADAIGRIIANCTDHDHVHQLKTSLDSLRSFISQLRAIRECTRKLCAYAKDPGDPFPSAPEFSASQLPKDF